jgi:uncharacterized protein YeeX (DUF496 family)
MSTRDEMWNIILTVMKFDLEERLIDYAVINITMSRTHFKFRHSLFLVRYSILTISTKTITLRHSY